MLTAFGVFGGGQDERGGATEEEFSKLEQDVEVVNKEISELSMELALVGAMVEAVNPAA